jgi:hypothetical protein
MSARQSSRLDVRWLRLTYRPEVFGETVTDEDAAEVHHYRQLVATSKKLTQAEFLVCDFEGHEGMW